MRAPRPINLDADLRRWRTQFPDATPIRDLRAREDQTVVGVVTRIRVTPGKSLTLRLSDGTGEIEATWSGRGSLRGITLGSALRLTATVGKGPSGTKVLRNPAWSPIAEPFSFPP
jgi:hypothetical protein